MISDIGLLYALVTAILFASFGLLARVLSVKSESPLALAVITGCWGAVFSVPIIFFAGGKFGDIDSKVIFITFLATLFFGVFEASQFFARKHLEASRSTIIFQLTPFVTFIGSVIFLGEGAALQKFLALGLIIGGNLIALYKHGGKVTSEGLFWALMTVIALGFAYVADKAVFFHYPVGVYLVISYIFPAFYVFLLMRKDRLIQLKKQFDSAGARIPLLALLSVGGYFFLLKTLNFTEVSVAVPIIYTSSILTVLGGVVILGERGNVLQKLLGAIVIFLGVILLR